MSGSEMTRWRIGRVVAALCALAVVVTIVVALFVAQPRNTVATHTHPAFNPTLACASQGCHANTHQHKFPYLGDCGKCHSLESWLVVNYTHADADFNAGTALHGVIGCERCHVEGGPLPSKACQSCHSSPHGGWNDCGQCHVPIGWIFRKPQPAGHLTLAGGHSGLSCLDCHNRANGYPTPRMCVDCHGVHHGGLTNCAQCHDPSSGWKPVGFDHSAVFKIEGRHIGLACAQCHPNGRFANTSSACVSCHGAHHGGLTDCAQCHSFAGFYLTTFDHSTVFPLARGPHATLECGRCHRGDDFAAQLGATCVTCHGLPHGSGIVDCRQCHAANGAVKSPFDHTAFFPLAGGPHAALACTQCHPHDDFAAQLGATCVTCHSLPHGSGLATCVPCHAANGAVDHSTFFELVGAHTTLSCSACHGTPFHAAAGTNCVDCHGIHHGDQTQCDECHTTTAFEPTKPITHPDPIVLGPEHSARPCQLCHTDLIFNEPTRPCSDCHTCPHVGPLDCRSCHMPTVWTDLHFTHPPLYAHSLQEFTCIQCHVGYNFTIPRAQICTECHPL